MQKHIQIPLLSAAQMRTVDELAVKEGLLVIQMMEHAALHIARIALKFKPKTILILAGKGNNGGDGIAAGRHLHNLGLKPHVLLSDHYLKLKETSLHHYKLLQKMGIRIEKWDSSLAQKQLFHQCDLIIDALLGYSIDGQPRQSTKELIEQANQSKKPILAVDIPSGLDGTSGKAYQACIKASMTLTLGLPKIGLIKKSAKPFVGKLYLADLGIPHFIYKKAHIKVPHKLFLKNHIVDVSRIIQFFL